MKNIIGSDLPVQIDSEGVSINEYCFEIGDHLIDINQGFIHSMFLMEGMMSFNELNTLQELFYCSIRKLFPN